MYCRNCGAVVSEKAKYCVLCGVPPMDGDKYCPNCKAETSPKAVVCVKCGVSLVPQSNIANLSPKSWKVTLLLCFFLGMFGVHRFYVGKVGTGILQLITFGGCGIWALIDFILIALSQFNDGNGLLIKDY